jgi:putative transposase
VRFSKKALTEGLKVSRGSLYYKHVKPDKDERLRILIECCMKENPAYGYRRVSQSLQINHKQAQRVMQKYNLKPFRRYKTPSKPKDLNNEPVIHPDITSIVSAITPDFIWVGDFTFISFGGKFVYLATVLDRYTSEVLGYSVSVRHTAELVVSAFTESLARATTKPIYFHSDQGSEYTSSLFTSILKEQGITISCSPKSSPWRNGAQESFFGRFKVEFGV